MPSPLTQADLEISSPVLVISAHRDGFCLRFGGEEVCVFPTWDGAAEAYRVAKSAVSELNKLLNRKGF